jgi:hypothetical protein
LCNYYSKFVKEYATLAAPLTDLLKIFNPPAGKKTPPLPWKEEYHTSAFEALKAAICSAPCLRFFNPLAKCCVKSDASEVAIGGVLQQPDAQGTLHPIVFYSRKLLSAERNYPVQEREYLALKECLRNWKHYLYGAQLFLHSDHESLKWLKS